MYMVEKGTERRLISWKARWPPWQRGLFPTPAFQDVSRRRHRMHGCCSYECEVLFEYKVPIARNCWVIWWSHQMQQHNPCSNPQRPSPEHVINKRGHHVEWRNSLSSCTIWMCCTSQCLWIGFFLSAFCCCMVSIPHHSQKEVLELSYT